MTVSIPDASPAHAGIAGSYGAANYTGGVKAVRLNRILVVLAFIGLFIAGVLSLEAKYNLLVPCGGSGGCTTVAASPSSHILGIPVAYFGLLGYLLLAALAIHRSALPTIRWSRSVTFGYLVAAIGSAESLWLQYQSFFVIRAECIWCISSAITMIATLVVYALLAQEVDNVIAATPIDDDEPIAAGTAVDTGAGEVTAAPAATSRPRLELRLPAALAVLVIAGVAIMGMTMKPGRFGAKPAPPNTSAKELVPPGAHIIGRPESPVTVVEFADLCCPTCQRISPQLKEYVLQHPGKVRLVYRNYPLPMHPQAMNAAAIAECAADSGRFWDYVGAVMALNRQPTSAEELFDIAKSTGLDVNRIHERIRDTNDPIYSRLARDLDTVHAVGIVQTPTFFTIYNGKVQETISSNEILDSLNSDKYQKIMNGPPAPVGPVDTEVPSSVIPPHGSKPPKDTGIGGLAAPSMGGGGG